MAAAEIQTLQVIIKFIQDVSGLKNVGPAAQSAGQKAGQAYAKGWEKGTDFNRLGKIGAAGVGGGLKFLQNTVLATAAAGTALEYSFIKVQKAQAGLARTLYGESGPAIALLNKQILDLSKTVPLAVTELYRIAEVIGTTNVAADNIDELTSVVAKLAATTDLSADEAAIGVARLLNMFGQIDAQGHIAAGAAESLGSEIVTASLAFASSDQEILRAALRFGALANSMHITQAQVLALAGAVTGLGQEPEAVGGSFQRMFQIINKGVGQGDQTFKDLKKSGETTAEAWATITKKGGPLARFAELAGMTAEEFDKAWKTKPYDTLLALERGFAKLTPTAQATLFGEGGIFPSFVRGMQTIQNLGVVEKLGQIGAEYAKIVEAGKRGVALDEQFAIATNTLTAKLQLLGNALVRGSVAFGDAFNKEFGDAILNLTNLINDNLGAFEEWGRNIANALKAIDWGKAKETIGEFFDIFAQGVKTTKALLDFIGPDVSKFLAQIYLINKLSGGAIKDVAGLFAGGVGGVLKVFFDQRLARGSSPANPLFVSDIGFGGVGGGLTIAGVSIAAIAAGVGAVILSQLPKFDPSLPGAGTPRAFSGSLGGPISDFFNGGRGFGGVPPQSSAFGHGSDVGLLANLADAWKASEQANAAMLSAANIMGPAANSLVTAAGILTEAGRKFLDSLKPVHRAGEKGRSLQSAEFGLINRTGNIDKVNAALADLIGHYTKEPIGSKNHPASFIIPAFKGIFPELKRDLVAAMKTGGPGLDKLLDNLRGLKALGIHLPPGLRRLIHVAERQKADANKDAEKNKHAIDKVKSAVTDAGDRIENLTAALRRKRLSVRVGGPRVNVRPGAVNVGATIVRVTVGTRPITRVVRTGTAWGPSLVFQQPGQIYEGPN